MSAIQEFRNEVVKWMCRNGIPNIDVDCDEDFKYNYGTHTIYCGFENFYSTQSIDFEQFLYEYGCEYQGIWTPVLAFLHECGHSLTNSNFTDVELDYYWIIKNLKDDFFEYWEVPDEFSANVFVIDFVNSKIDAVAELCEIFINGYKAIYDEGEIWDYIVERGKV